MMMHGGFPVATNGRDKALESAISNITKQFGEGTLMRLGDATHLAVESVSTGSLSLDIAVSYTHLTLPTKA